MAEALKRWDGTQWVTVAAVNRIEVGGSGGGLIAQPIYTQEYNYVDYFTANETLTPKDYVSTPVYSYTIT